MLNYKGLDKKFDDVLNSISHEEVRKWDFFDKYRLNVEHLKELIFSESVDSIFADTQFDSDIDSMFDNCSDNRFALAA